MVPSFDLAELVGNTPDEAVRRLRAEGFQVQVVEPGMMVTMDYNPGRVRVFTKDGVVERAEQG